MKKPRQDNSLERALKRLLEDRSEDSMENAKRILARHTEGFSVLDVNGDHISHHDTEKEAERCSEFWAGSSVVPGNRGIEGVPLKRAPKGIRCPACKSMGPFKYVEEVTAFYDVVTIDRREKELQVESLTDSDSYSETGENARLLCTKGKCCTEFPIPSTYSTDWV